MTCKIVDLKDKEVINMKDGYRLGYVCDLEFDTVTGGIMSLIVYGKPRAFGLLGREDDIVIKWEDIEIIGDDTILVCCDTYFPPQQPQNQGKTRRTGNSIVKSIWN